MSSSPPPLFLLLGPSGAGKSFIARAMAESKGMLHIEIDLWQADGIDAAGLRKEWDAFYWQNQPDALAHELARRAVAGGYKGVVASLPSVVVLTRLHIESGQRVGLTSVILYGSAADCLNAFTQREAASGRALDPGYWFDNNTHAYMAYSLPDYAQFRVDAFVDGVQRKKKALVAEVLRRAGG